MKKTHLYGAVAATMLLAPVTANLLAAENEGNPDEEWIEVMDPGNGQDDGLNTGMADSSGTERGATNSSDGDTGSSGDESNDGGSENNNLDDTGVSEAKTPEGTTPKENLGNTEETNAEKKNARLNAEDEMITIPAEEMYIPDPVTTDEEILIQKNYGSSETGTLNNWMESLDGIKVSIYDSKANQNVYEKNFAIDPSKFDMSQLSDMQFFNGEEFRSYLRYDMNDIITTIEKEIEQELNSERNQFLDLLLDYNHLNKKWKLNVNCETKGDSTYLTYSTVIHPLSVKDYFPDLDQATEGDLEDEKIIQDFYNGLQALDITLDGEKIQQVELTRDDFMVVKPTTIVTVPERAVAGIPNSVTITINTQALAKRLGFSKNVYHIASTHLEEGTEPTIRYAFGDSKSISLYFTTNRNWKMASVADRNLKIDYKTLDIDEFLKEMDSLTNALKVHIYDISDQNKVTEFEYDPKNASLSDDVNINEFGVVIRGGRSVGFDRDGYLKKYEELKNGKYKFAISQTGGLYKQLAYKSSIYWGREYQPELVIYVEKDTLSENQYSNNGVQLSAKSNEDLYGLEFKAENSTSDHNFGFDSANETIGYTLSFINRQGEKVERTGTFEVQMSIPTGWSGKALKVYQVDQSGNKELLSILMDGKVIFTPASLTTFVLVKEAESENPIKTEATFTKGGYQVKAESKEDLTGLQIVIDKVEADNNFGLTSNYQTIGYDIHFENEEGKEIDRTGKFKVRLPIPEQFAGKNVRIFHKENQNSKTTELQFKIIDGKYYEFETTSFSWFIIASEITQAVEKPTDNNKPNEKPTDQNKPMTPAEEANKPVVKPTVNEGNETKVIPVKAESTIEKVKGVSKKHSPETGIAIQKSSSMWMNILSLLGLGWIVHKKRNH